MKLVKKKSTMLVDPKEHRIVYQHNKLVEAKYDMSLQEKRILLWALARIKKEDIALKTVLISVSELCEAAGIENTYRELKKAVLKLRNRTMTIVDLDERTHTYVGWLDHIKYHEKQGVVEIQFHRFLEQFLIGLKNNFTIIPLSQTLGLSSTYAIRMFELLKQYENIGERKFDLNELRENLGVDDGKFINYKDFRIKVLEISQRELSLKTDIRFDFEEIKTSRKVTDLKIKIYKNDPQKNLIEHKEKEKIKRVKAEIISEYEKKELIEIGFSLPTIRKFFKEFPDQQIRNALQVTLDQIEKGQVKNAKALFQKALKESWKIDSN